MTTAPIKIQETVADSALQKAIYTATGRLVAHRASSLEAFPEYQDLRTAAHELKRHTIDNLDYYLEQFEQNVAAHGGKAVFAKDATEVADFVRSEEQTSELQSHSFISYAVF